MELRDTIVESQRKIIDALADCELHISLLYTKYAECFPETMTNWLGLAAEEKTHSNLLRSMHRILDKGRIFYNLGKFDSNALKEMDRLINNSLKEANNPAITYSDVISAAFKIETSIIESKFYDVVASDAPEFKIIAQRLTEDTKRHVELVRSRFHTEINTQREAYAFHNESAR